MVRIIKGRAPLRVDLAGAWSDIPFYSDLYGGKTINAAINIYVNGEIRFEKDGSFDFKYGLHFPSGSGLGSSGALNVLYYAIINYENFLEKKLTKEDVALGAYYIERALGAKCGKQDQCAAAYGGISRFYFGSQKTQYNLRGEAKEQHIIKHQKVTKENLEKELSNRLLLINTKIIHSSSAIIHDIQNQFENDMCNFSLSSSNGKIKKCIRNMADSTYDLSKNLINFNMDNISQKTNEFIGKNIELTPHYFNTDWEKVGEIISYQFDMMKEMSLKTTNPIIEKIIKKINPYIYGAKPGGAGGGGCIICLCKSAEHLEDLKGFLEEDEFLSQFDCYNVIIDNDGIQVWET